MKKFYLFFAVLMSLSLCSCMSRVQEKPNFIKQNIETTEKETIEVEKSEEKEAEIIKIKDGMLPSLPHRDLTLKEYKIEQKPNSEEYILTLYLDYTNTGDDDNAFNFSTALYSEIKAYQDGVSLDYEGGNEDYNSSIKPGTTVAVEVYYELRNLDSDVEFTFQGYSFDASSEPEEAYYTLKIK